MTTLSKDNGQFINAVFWILRTGAPSRDLPPEYGRRSNTHRRFIRWRDKSIWESLLEKVVTDPDFEWLMIDASHIKVHPHAAGAKGGSQERGPHNRGLNTKVYLAVDAPWDAGQNHLQTVPWLIARKLTHLLKG